VVVTFSEEPDIGRKTRSCRVFFFQASCAFLELAFNLSGITADFYSSFSFAFAFMDTVRLKGSEEGKKKKQRRCALFPSIPPSLPLPPPPYTLLFTFLFSLLADVLSSSYCFFCSSQSSGAPLLKQRNDPFFHSLLLSSRCCCVIGIFSFFSVAARIAFARSKTEKRNTVEEEETLFCMFVFLQSSSFP
jgi:hypothetical protein